MEEEGGGRGREGCLKKLKENVKLTFCSHEQALPRVLTTFGVFFVLYILLKTTYIVLGALKHLSMSLTNYITLTTSPTVLKKKKI